MTLRWFAIRVVPQRKSKASSAASGQNDPPNAQNPAHATDPTAGSRLVPSRVSLSCPSVRTSSDFHLQLRRDDRHRDQAQRREGFPLGEPRARKPPKLEADQNRVKGRCSVMRYEVHSW